MLNIDYISEQNFLAASLLGMIYLIVSMLYFRYYMESKLLHSSLRSIIRTGRIPVGVKFSFENLSNIWRSLLTLHSEVKNYELYRHTTTEALSLSTTVSAAAYDISAAAHEVVATIIHQASPEVAACAILTKDSQDTSLYFQVCRGVAESRISEPLLMHVEDLIDAHNPIRWGYYLPIQGDLLDFSVFGLYQQLFVPLKLGETVRGALWLGFRKGTPGISCKRMEWIRIFALHAAASLNAASQVHYAQSKVTKQYSSVLDMSHDMRAPGVSALFAIKDLLENSLTSFTEEQTEKLYIIEKAIEDQLSLIDDILDFSKSKTGSLRAQIETVSLQSILERLTPTIISLAANKNVNVFVPQISQLYVMVDARHLYRILSNLFSNAVKYCDAGEIRIEIKTLTGKIEIDVCDTGIGVPQSERNKIFEQFQRASNTSGKHGVGLGLALSKHLAELNGGQLNYQPRPGGGSIFSLILRSVDNAECEISTPTINTILVVDDEPAACRTTLRYLKDISEHSVSAHGYREAITFLNNTTPDLLITDLNLGDGTAINLIKDLATRGDIPHTIILTGTRCCIDLSDITACHAHKIKIMEKPITREEIRGAAFSMLSQ